MFFVNLFCEELILNKRFSKTLLGLNRLFSASSTEQILSVNKNEYIHYEFPKYSEDNDLVNIKRQKFDSSFAVIPNAVSIDEESRLIDEIEKSLKRLRYQHDHWDDVSKYNYTLSYLSLILNAFEL